jgi:hypothetical protein
MSSPAPSAFTRLHPNTPATPVPFRSLSAAAPTFVPTFAAKQSPGSNAKSMDLKELSRGFGIEEEDDEPGEQGSEAGGGVKERNRMPSEKTIVDHGSQAGEVEYRADETEGEGNDDEVLTNPSEEDVTTFGDPRRFSMGTEAFGRKMRSQGGGAPVDVDSQGGYESSSDEDYRSDGEEIEEPPHRTLSRKPSGAPRNPDNWLSGGADAESMLSNPSDEDEHAAGGGAGDGIEHHINPDFVFPSRSVRPLPTPPTPLPEGVESAHDSFTHSRETSISNTPISAHRPGFVFGHKKGGSSVAKLNAFAPEFQPTFTFQAPRDSPRMTGIGVGLALGGGGGGPSEAEQPQQGPDGPIKRQRLNLNKNGVWLSEDDEDASGGLGIPKRGRTGDDDDDNGGKGEVSPGRRTMLEFKFPPPKSMVGEVRKREESDDGLSTSRSRNASSEYFATMGRSSANPTPGHQAGSLLSAEEDDDNDDDYRRSRMERERDEMMEDDEPSSPSWHVFEQVLDAKLESLREELAGATSLRTDLDSLQRDALLDGVVHRLEERIGEWVGKVTSDAAVSANGTTNDLEAIARVKTDAGSTRDELVLAIVEGVRDELPLATRAHPEDRAKVVDAVVDSIRPLLAEMQQQLAFGRGAPESASAAGQEVPAALAEVEKRLAAVLDGLNAERTTHRNSLEGLVAGLAPRLEALKPVPLDTDELTYKLSEAVKPRIIELIDFASDKKETAALITSQLRPEFERLDDTRIRESLTTLGETLERTLQTRQDELKGFVQSFMEETARGRADAAKIAELEGQLAKARAEYGKVRSEKAVIADRLEVDRSRYSTETQELRDSLQKRNAELEDLRSQLRERQASCVELEATKTRLEERLADSEGIRAEQSAADRQHTYQLGQYVMFFVLRQLEPDHVLSGFKAKLKFWRQRSVRGDCPWIPRNT